MCWVIPQQVINRSPTAERPWSGLRYVSLKLMPRFENPSVAGPEFRDKRKCGRPKCEHGRSKREHGRYVSEAAPRFGNLCVYEPSALWKKLSDSRKKPSDFRMKPSGLRQSHAANAFRKGVPNHGINFKHAYRISLELWQLTCKLALQVACPVDSTMGGGL